jgi:hypothetical protein
MTNRQGGKTVSTASVRRENPERLRPVISFDSAAALGPFFRVHLSENSIVDGSADDPITVGDLAPFSVNHFAANLDGGQPVVNVTLRGASGWNLGELDFQSRSKCPEVREHGNTLFALQDGIEFYRERCPLARDHGTHVDNVAENGCAGAQLKAIL